jgi:hypothetical protein
MAGESNRPVSREQRGDRIVLPQRGDHRGELDVVGMASATLAYRSPTMFFDRFGTVLWSARFGRCVARTGVAGAPST